MNRPLVMAVAAAALGASAAVRAHDLWLVPESFLPRPGATVRLEVRIGERFPESMNAPREGSLSRLALVTAAGESPLSGARIEGKALAVRFEAPAAGNAALVLEGPARHIVLPPEQFKDYLLHEGLAQIHEERLARGEANKPGREDYSRHAKALLRVGPGEGIATRPLGLTLELVPEADPYAIAPEEPLPVKALFRGAPLPDLELRSYTIGGAVRKTRTGPDGRSSLRFDRPGLWCVAFIHMERCTGCAEADWRSYFGTLTFEVPSPSPSP